MRAQLACEPVTWRDLRSCATVCRAVLRCAGAAMLCGDPRQLGPVVRRCACEKSAAAAAHARHQLTHATQLT
jgi:hypothetical protein